MKKYLAISYWLLAISFCGSAQDYYRHPATTDQTYRRNNHFKDSLGHKFFFSFNAGLSIPLSDFASKDTGKNFMVIGPDTSHAKGFANVGFHMNLKGGIYLAPSFGLVAKIAYSYNTFDANTLNNIINGYYYYTINGNYNIFQFMGGAFFDTPLNPVTSFWAEAMLGDIHANFPSFSILIGPETINGSLSPANNLVYSIGIGLQKNLTDNVNFIATLNYTGAQLAYPTFTYTYLGTYPGAPPNGYTVTQIHPVTMAYGSLDFTVGLLFKL